MEKSYYLIMAALVSHTVFGNCFDFSQKVTEPLMSPIAFSKDRSDTITKGDRKGEEGGWGAARAIIKRPLSEIYEVMKNPLTIKDPEKTKVETKEIPSPHYLLLKHLDVTLKAILFVTIDWEEEWAFSLLDGKKENPKKILLSYQKIAGTRHLKHLCGNMLLQKRKTNETDIFLYEEADSSHWTKDDIANSFIGTLKTLRGEK